VFILETNFVKRFILILSIVYGACAVKAQEPDKNKQYFLSCIGFYNVENLYDTIDAKDVDDFEFTPQGSNKWTSARYYKKLDNLAEVISQMGTDVSPDGLAILGLAEIENRKVVEDLVATSKLKSRKYEIVHYDSPDKRGVDVGLIYQPQYFTVENSKAYKLQLPNDPEFRTRDQLLVSGKLHGEEVHVLVAHWPSRRGGEKKSRPLRVEAAKLSRHIMDSIALIQPEAKIIFMGDLNDDPVNVSVRETLKAKGDKLKVQDGELFNAMESYYHKGIGTLAWRDSWNLFDQLILSKSLLPTDFSNWQFYTSKVYNKAFLCQTEGSYKGYPLRTFAGGNYAGGYSDHFPVYLILLKENK
jgi:hypothetical protein